MKFSQKMGHVRASGFIEELEAFATKIMGLPKPQTDQAISYTNPAQPLYGSNGEAFVNNNLAIQALTAQEPLITQCTLQQFQFRKKSGGNILFAAGKELAPKENALNACHERYAGFFDVIFALSDIYEGGLRIDNTPLVKAEWKFQRTCFDTYFKEETLQPNALVDIQQSVLAPPLKPYEEIAKLKALIEKSLDKSHAENSDTIRRWQSEINVLRNGEPYGDNSFDNWLRNGGGGYVKGTPVTEALVDAYMQSPEYQQWRDARQGLPGMGDHSGDFHASKRLKSTAMHALWNYGDRVEPGEIIVPEIDAFIRKHQWDIKSLEKILYAAEMKEQEAKYKRREEKLYSSVPEIKPGTPAEWFAKAQSHQIT